MTKTADYELAMARKALGLCVAIPEVPKEPVVQRIEELTCDCLERMEERGKRAVSVRAIALTPSRENPNPS